MERDRLDLRSEVHLLKERREALEQELKSRATAAHQNAEEVAQERAESNALRSVLIPKLCTLRSEIIHSFIIPAVVSVES